MNNFDDIIRAKVKSEPIALPKGFEERNDILISELYAHSGSSKRIGKFPSLHLKSPAAVILAALLLTGVSVAAYNLSGGDFFKHFFADKANNNEYSYMNTDQLEKMASSTVGTVVDTDEITIDVMGVIVSGNTTKIMLKITANQLDSVLYDTGIEPLENYRFNDEISGSLFEDFGMASTRYFYSNKENSLAPNQFEILYTINRSSNFKKGQYTIKLNKFGYFSIGDGPGTDFVSKYDKSWQFNIVLDSNSDTSKKVLIDKLITVGNNSFILNSININPLACTINLKCNQDDKYLKEHLKEIFKAFSDGTENCCLTLSNGMKLSTGQFEKTHTAGEKDFTVVLTFNVPVAVKDVISISLFGTEYSLK